MFTGIQPAFATRNSPAMTPSPIIERMMVAVATSRSHRITDRLYYGLPVLSLRAARDRDPAPRHEPCPRRAREALQRDEAASRRRDPVRTRRDRRRPREV